MRIEPLPCEHRADYRRQLRERASANCLKRKAGAALPGESQQATVFLMLSVLTHSSYRRFFAAQVLSLLGTGLTTVALGLLAFDLAGADAGVVLGTALALKMLVYVGLSPVAEVIARRVPRKRFLVGLDLLRASFVLFLPFVTEVWQIYVLVVLFQSCSAAFTPVFQATIPELVPEEEDYTKALSLSRLAYDLEALLSPMLAGLLLGLASFHVLFVGTTIGFLASAVLIVGAVLPASAEQPPERTSFRARLVRGSWIYLATPRLRGLLALSLAVSAAGAMVIVNTVVLVQAEFAGSDRQVALLFAAYGAGSICIALSLPHLLHVVSERFAMLLGGGLLVIALMVFPTLESVSGAGLLWGIMGGAAALVQTPAGLLLRRSANPEDRPAVFAAQFALSHACWLISYPLAGWGGALLGLETVALVLGALALIGVSTAFFVWPAADPLELEHEHEEIEHDHGPRSGAHDHHAGVEGSLSGRHKHPKLRHSHPFVIDDHHPVWPRS